GLRREQVAYPWAAAFASGRPPARGVSDDLASTRPREEFPAGGCRSGCMLSHDRVLAGGLSEPLGAELGDSLQGLEIDVDQPEPSTVSIHPFEVVLSAPLEVPVYGDALRGRPLKLTQVGAQEHDSVGVVDLPVVGDHV